MDIGQILKKQIDDLLAKDEIESALVACFSALSIEPFNFSVIMSCTEIFTKLRCLSEAKTLYLIYLGIAGQNKEVLAGLKEVHENNLISAIEEDKPLYVKQITGLVVGAVAVEMERMEQRWHMTPEEEPEKRYWIAACIMKFSLPRLKRDEQEKWLRIFKGYFVPEKMCLDNMIDVTSLPLAEKYFYSSLRYALAVFYLGHIDKLEEGSPPLVEIASLLLAIDVWRFGCLDEYDQNILEKIVKLFSSFTSKLYSDNRQFLVCLSLMFFRNPDRVCKSMDSDKIFHAYLGIFKDSNPQQNENVYCSRALSLNNLPQERMLWFVENYASLIKFRNKHVGESCYIIGNGPSLNRMDLSPLRDKITFGMNKIYLLFDKLGFETSYLVAANPYVLQQASPVFKGLGMPLFLMMWGREFIEKQQNVNFLRERKESAFSYDLTKGVAVHCTVTHMALQLSYYMGFKTVILIGIDHNFVSKGDPHSTVKLTSGDPNHFDPNYFGYGIPWQLPDLEGSELAYKNSRQAFEADGRRVLDATVDGKLQVFEKIDYLESLKI